MTRFKYLPEDNNSVEILSLCHFNVHNLNIKFYVQVEFSLKRNKSRKFLY